MMKRKKNNETDNPFNVLKNINLFRNFKNPNTSSRKEKKFNK